MNNPINTSQTLSRILAQFHCEDSSVELAKQVFAKLTNNKVEAISCLSKEGCKTSDHTNESTPLIDDKIAEVINEANRNTPSIAHKRLKIILAACFCSSVKELKSVTGADHKALDKWCSRFLRYGIEGLRDAHRSGRPVVHTADNLFYVLMPLLNFKPSFLAEKIVNLPKDINKKLKYLDFWTAPAISSVLGCSESTVRRFLESHNIEIRPNLSSTYCFSNDPNFEQKLEDVVNLYTLPLGIKDDEGREIVVICFDEMPGIPVRSAIYCKNSANVIVNSSEYTRLGTTNLFCALEPKTGKVICEFQNDKTRATVEDFLSTVAKHKQYKDKHIHFVMDNFRAHYNFSSSWWDEFRGRVEIHYTPVHCSWANLGESFFSIFKRNILKGRSFNSLDEFKDVSSRFFKI